MRHSTWLIIHIGAFALNWSGAVLSALVKEWWVVMFHLSFMVISYIWIHDAIMKIDQLEEENALCDR